MQIKTTLNTSTYPAENNLKDNTKCWDYGATGTLFTLPEIMQ